MLNYSLPAAPGKTLLIEQDPENFTPVETMPEEYLHLLIPYARAHFYHDEDCDMISQHIQLDEFSLWSHDIFAMHDITLYPFTPYQILALHYMHEASVDTEITGMGHFRLGAQECNLFNLHAHFHSAVLPAGKKMNSFHINTLPHALRPLAVKYPELLPLAGKEIGPVSGPLNQQPYLINQVCKWILEDIFECRLVELQATCFLHRCCVNLYGNFARQDAEARQIQVPLSILERASLYQLLLAIRTYAGRQFPLHDLAFRCRKPEQALAAGFEQLFGVTIEVFSLQQKMRAAYNLVVKKSISLRDIAARTGFKSITAFRAAFLDYFEEDAITIRNAQ